MFGYSEINGGSMIYKVESNHIINEEIVSKLYNVHKKVYITKNIGKPFQDWQKDFYTTYHNVVQKKTLLFSSTSNINNLDGYLIITEPLKVNSFYWSKILEGGMGSPINQRTNFIKMFQCLFQYGANYGINFFSESGPGFKSLLKILYDLEFFHINEITNAIELFSAFLGNSSFIFSRVENHLVVKRKTKICDDYTGFILERKAVMKKEEYLAESSRMK